MDTLIYPPAAPIPLILPRSLSFQAGSSNDYKGSSRTRKPSFTTEPASPFSLSSATTSPIAIESSSSSTNNNQQSTLHRQSSFTFPASTSLPATYTFLPPPESSSSSNSSKSNSPTTTTMIRSQIRRQRRRHSITGGGFAWTTTTSLPPRHALHMPVMKISPLIRRKEQHQRNIHRLMHEGREVEVMRRRGVATVMDTSEEGDEDDEEGMAGVVFTGASIQQSALLNEHAQMQAKQEFAMLVAESSKAYQGILQQRHLQQQQRQEQEQQQRAAAAAIEDEEQRRRNSWPKQQITTGTGAIAYANVPLTFQQQQQQQHVYLQQQAQQQQRLIQLQQQQRQLQFQQQKQLLLQQQQQLQQQIQQQQLYKQRLYASSNPALNIQTGFPSPPQQQQPQQSQQQQQLMQIQTPQQRGANALNFVKNLNQNNAATTAANWNYSSQYSASTGRLSLY